MADESGWKIGTEVTMEESGASTADAIFSPADDVSGGFVAATDNLISTGVHGTHLRVVLSTVDTITNPTVGGVVNIYAKPLNFEGTEDGEPPTANYPHTFVCAMPIDDDQAITQDIARELVRNPFPHLDIDFFIENQCGQTISAGWNLRVSPMYYAPGA